MMLRWLQKTGHKPITLMGGGTTKVGDPSFRSDERPLLTPEQIAANIATIRGVFAKYLDYGDAPDRRDHARQRRVARRASTTSTFLRDIGRHFSVNRMLSFESVKSRLDREQPLSLPRVQLHDPAGLRLPRAPPPRGLPAADGRLGPVGQHRQRHRPDPPRRGRRGLRADLAAPHHLRRRARWASPPAARSGSTPRCSAPTTSGSSGATPPTPTSAASSSSTPSCRVDECDRLGALGGAEINAAKITPRQRGDDALPRRRGRRRRRGDRPRGLRAGRRRRGARGGDALAPPTLGAGLASTHFLVAAGAREVRQGGQAADRREAACASTTSWSSDPNAPRHRRGDRRRAQGLDRQEAPRVVRLAA